MLKRIDYIFDILPPKKRDKDRDIDQKTAAVLRTSPYKLPTYCKDPAPIIHIDRTESGGESLKRLIFFRQ